MLEKADRNKLFNFIKGRVEDNTETEEIFQETLISIYESQDRFLEKSTIFTWAISIAKHEIADYYRKKKIKIFLFSRLPWLENLASQALGPEQILLKKEMEIRVRRVMGRIRGDYQEVLKLKYYEGLSVLEIADKLNETTKTIESRLTRARSAFVKIYSSDNG